MKKTVISIFTLVLVYLGANFYTGILVKKSFDESLVKLNSELRVQGLDLYVTEYKRGFFTTTIEMNLGPVIPLFSDTDEKVGLNTETKLYHGPILFIHDFGLGQFSSVTKLIPKTKISAFNNEYKKIFGDSIGKLFVASHFGGTYQAHWKMDSITFNNDGDKFTLDKSTLNITGDLKNNRTQGDFSWGAMHLDSNKGEHIEFSSTPITSHFDFTKMEQAYLIGNFDLGLNNFSFKKNGVPLEVQKISIKSDSKVVGKGLDTKVKFTMGELKGPVVIKNLYYAFELNQLNIAALKHLNEVQQKLAADTTTPSPQTALLSLAQVFPEFLQPGLNFKFAMGVNYKDENIKLSLDAKYHPLPNGMKLSEITSPNDYLLLLDADFAANIPKSLDTTGTFAPLVGTRVKETEKDYLIDAKFRDAHLTVGTEEVPIDQFIGQIMTSFQQMKGGSSDQTNQVEQNDQTEQPEQADQ